MLILNIWFDLKNLAQSKRDSITFRLGNYYDYKLTVQSIYFIHRFTKNYISMGRKSLKEIRQKEIIEVFYRVAQREGMENTSIAKVAKQMDINPSLIMHYFKTKDELTNAFITYILDRYIHIFDVNYSTDDPFAQLEHVLDKLFSEHWNTLIDDSLFYSAYALTFRNERARIAFK